ncbi:glycosyltransferase [Pseudaminobacter sp. NGMCC 1.201702]|uniref:glycosyltransferase n=1 Tax=Pseudaminobacter sp. NGMCC 1.201702 TaxID=3391825 RepID=UPI0039F0CA84
MRIVIDGQALQSPRTSKPSRDALHMLVHTLIAAWAEHDVILALSGLLPDRIERIRAEFEATLSPGTIRLWYAVEPVYPNCDSWQHGAAQLIREGFLASLDPDLILVPLPLDPEVDDIVFSTNLLADIPTAIYLDGTSGWCQPRRPLCAGSPLQRLSGVFAAFAPMGTDPDLVASLTELDPAKIALLDTDIELAEQVAQRLKHARRPADAKKKPTLALVSPLPPEQSGISFYCNELLPVLSQHYSIDIIVDQKQVTDPWTRENCKVRDLDWFSDNAGQYDRILYHFGNSRFHQHMFALLDQHPGVVVLHDFFLSGIVSHMDTSGHTPSLWLRELYSSHGYGAVKARFVEKDQIDVIWRYPCSGGVVERAIGVIVHAHSSRSLARHWYGIDAEQHIVVIPHLRAPATQTERSAARRLLDLGEDDFIVCSFGGLGPTKLNHQLLDAWFGSALSSDRNCRLIFVGASEGGRYGREMMAAIEKHPDGSRIRITGWVDVERFHQYLSAADMAVQLRTLSRGETSGTVLDCMNHGVPLIVNAHGSMSELPDAAVYMLRDQFEQSDLVEALERFHDAGSLRAKLAARALDHIRRHHSPTEIAALYFEAIENFASRPRAALARLAPALATVVPPVAPPGAHEALAACAAVSIQPALATRQLLFDISAIARKDLKTGIERAVRALLNALIACPPEGFRVEPIYSHDGGFFYARRFTTNFLGGRSNSLRDEPVEMRSGDIYFMADLEHQQVIRNRRTFRAMRNHGVSVNFMVHDLLPLQFPHFFPPHAAATHQAWLEVVAEADRAICVSRTVAADLTAWLVANTDGRGRAPGIFHSHNGADLFASSPTSGLPRKALRLLDLFRQAPSFLMVGTVEPRKGHEQVLESFEEIWAADGNEQLVIVGKPGWMVDSLIRKLRRHRERNRRLFWIEDASDEFLDRIYASCTCLIAASHGEGFGLPLIEAATKGLPIIARDIPVFREVAGDHAFYFKATATPAELSAALGTWLRLNRRLRTPNSSLIRRLTWEESAEQLKRHLFASRNDRQAASPAMLEPLG